MPIILRLYQYLAYELHSDVYRYSRGLAIPDDFVFQTGSHHTLRGAIGGLQKGVPCDFSDDWLRRVEVRYVTVSSGKSFAVYDRLSKTGADRRGTTDPGENRDK